MILERHGLSVLKRKLCRSRILRPRTATRSDHKQNYDRKDASIHNHSCWPFNAEVKHSFGD